MFRAQSTHHQEVNDVNCTYAASGIITLCKWPSCATSVFVVGPARPQTQHDCHHDTKVKPEAATAVIELLMMGGKTPETCWAVNKRQDNKLINCCIRLVIYLRLISTPPSPFLSSMEQHRPVSQVLLIIEASWSHSDTPHSVGLLWTSDKPVVETSTWQITTLTTDIHAP
jgi:hypothetical protein